MTNRILNGYVISILAPRNVLHVHALFLLFSCCFFIFLFFVFFSKIRSTSGGIHKRHLVEGSDRRYADEMILFLPSYLKFTHERDRNCIRISSPRTSEKKIQAALAVSCFFSWFEWRPLAFFSRTRAALFTLTCPQKNIVLKSKIRFFDLSFPDLRLHAEQTRLV